MSVIPNEPVIHAPPSYAKGDFVADKYLLEQLLEEGGMGSVWLAHNIDLDAPVAIKLVRFDAANQEASDRLKREARLEARLEHRAIVRVFDCGETDKGDPFIAMELLQGMSLAAALDLRGPLSVTTAVQILLPIIDGLSAAHDKGIVHRDIKPGNIFLARATRHIQPKVLDFGIAKLDRWNPDPKITLDGTVIGSPAYMAPEQARGRTDVDHRADIWAICAVLYESITSSPPFRGDSYNAVLRSIVEDDVAPLEVDSDAARALWPILERGFSKDRELRFQSMCELGTALAEFLLGQGVADDVCGESLAMTWGQPSGSKRSLDATPSAPVGSARVGRSSRPLLELLPESDDAKTETMVAPDFGPTSTNDVVTPPGRMGVRRGRPSTIFRLLAASIALGTLAFAVWRANGAVWHTSAAASPNVETPAPAQTVENCTPAVPLPSSAPEAPASTTPSVGAVVSAPMVPSDESLTNARAGARPKRPTAAKAPKRASATDVPRPRSERRQGTNAEILGLKTPY
jgi:serine/threonine-protein kinase